MDPNTPTDHLGLEPTVAALEELRAQLDQIDDPADLTPQQREAAASMLLFELERIGYALQMTWQAMAVFCGVPKRRVHEIERDAIAAEGAAMDEAAGL